ncbi:MAG TPA: hypothetical protein VIQ24_20560 [Pyrinomonadaceae bacterium]
MKEESENDEAIRRLLLGLSDDKERRGVEELFMTDPEYREKVLVAEDDLIEDYLDGSLSEGERQRFRTHFLSTPRQQRRVRVTRELRSFAAVEVTAHSPPAEEDDPQPVGWLRRLADALRLRESAVYVPLAAALVAALVLGSWWLFEFSRAPQLRAQEESRRLEVERLLARFNDPSGTGLPEPGAPVFSLPLTPVNVRGETQIVPPQPDSGVVELRLLRAGNGYNSYKATLQRVGGLSQYSIPGLRDADTSAGRAVPIRIPARLLTPGTYRLKLSGVGADSQPVELDEYTFQREE